MYRCRHRPIDEVIAHITRNDVTIGHAMYAMCMYIMRADMYRTSYLYQVVYCATVTYTTATVQYECGNIQPEQPNSQTMYSYRPRERDAPTRTTPYSVTVKETRAGTRSQPKDLHLLLKGFDRATTKRIMPCRLLYTCRSKTPGFQYSRVTTFLQQPLVKW